MPPARAAREAGCVPRVPCSNATGRTPLARWLTSCFELPPSHVGHGEQVLLLPLPPSLGERVGWVDPGWPSGAHPSCSVAALLSCTGERKHEKLVAQGGDREITQQLPSWEKLM